MTDILIRGLSTQSVARLDAKAAQLGLSRNEYLRRQLDQVASEEEASVLITPADLQRASRAASDLDDADVMSAAWR